MKSANQSIEPTGGSRFCPSAFVSQRRLPPVAHAHRLRRNLSVAQNEILMGKWERSLAREKTAVLRGPLILAFIMVIILVLLGIVR